MRSDTFFSMTGCIFAGLAVVTGAFAAHGLDTMFTEMYPDATRTIAGMTVPLSWKYIQDFKTAALYQFLHALGLIAVGLFARHQPGKALAAAGWLFIAGIVFFSGSLYVLTLTGLNWLGAIAPIGGTAFILGWCAFAAGICGCCTPPVDPEIPHIPPKTE